MLRSFENSKKFRERALPVGTFVRIAVAPLFYSLKAVLSPSGWAFAPLWPWVLGSLAVILLLSGLDDFIPILMCLRGRWRQSGGLAPAFGTEIAPERRIAIFVPCWKEYEVIGNMVRHNVAAIRYKSYDFFLGVYPNDDQTLAAGRQLASSFRNVHVAECAHPGPTSKADCLNWIYQRMLLFEEDNGVRFDTIVLHDAEDMIHPEALSQINRLRAEYAMVQIPVLPLPTKLREITHGVYCDEFAEFQTIDMRARQHSGAFVPSNGVGTGFAREILEQLAVERNNEVFDPASLTEDYEIGLYVRSAGYKQVFAPLKRENGDFIATREFFPRTAKTAIRQRTRWITGIALQSWQRNGWRGTLGTRYWFWRDRKGLLTNPISVLTNVLFFAGITDWFASAVQHRPWAFAVRNSLVVLLCCLTMGVQCFRLTLRMFCTGRIFGWTFASGVLLRSFHANMINSSASLRALWSYMGARRAGRTLVWQKTDHAYPSRDALVHHQRTLSDVLMDLGHLSEEQAVRFHAELPEQEALIEMLLSQGMLSEDDLCGALSVQCGVPSARVDIQKVRQRVVRSLPSHIEKRYSIMPFSVAAGKLLVAGARVPPSEAFEELKNFTPLRVDFQLVPKSNYEELRALL